MKVVKISEDVEAGGVFKKYCDDIVSGNVLFILKEDKPLFEFIEELSIDGKLLYNLKIANEIDFLNTPVKIEDKYSKRTIKEGIASLSGLIEAFPDVDSESLRVIFDTEDKELISRVCQALIYLDKGIDIIMKKEEKDRKVLEAFRKKYDGMRLSIEKEARDLKTAETGIEFEAEKEELLKNLLDIEDELERARERDLKVAVMATKKAGKSVIVNSFLKEQYAPTSLELPTPNNCIYKRSRDNVIRLLYGGNEILFKNPKEVYSYILKEFKRAQIEKSGFHTLDDMEIQYIGHTNTFGSFTIIDTPGSNYALAKNGDTLENLHRNLSYEWIEKADVIIFVINYSTYLTADEEEFFRDIKKRFESMNKFYSLIVVVNKMDEMYVSEFENKSVVRFLDYIRHLLYELGYKGFVVIGTSARTYFDALRLEALDRESADKIENYVPAAMLKGDMLRKRIRLLKQIFAGKPEMSVLSFADDQLANLEWFHGLSEYSLDDLYRKSGIPALEKYTEYIALQKANIETYREIIRGIDEKFVRISNKTAAGKLAASKYENIEKIKEIEEMLRQIEERFEIIKKETGDKLGFEAFKKELSAYMENRVDGILNHMLEIGEARIDEYFMKLLLKSSEELKNIKNGTMPIEFDTNEKLFKKEMDDLASDSMGLLNKEVSLKEEMIKNAEKSMREIVESFSFAVRREYSLREFNMIVPKADIDFKTEVLSNIPRFDIDDDEIKEKIRESIEFKTTAVQNVFNSFRREKQGTYCVNSAKLKTANKEYIEKLKSESYIRFYKSLEETFSKAINRYEERFSKIFREIIALYEDVIHDMLEGLKFLKENAEIELSSTDSRLGFYFETGAIIGDFVGNWEYIRNS